MQEHHFNLNIATKYGINCAVILHNICFWVEKSEANREESKFFDGKYWTYNSIKAFERQFPYLSARQIRYSLDSLQKEGLILTANYNKDCDRTLWYTITQKAIDIINGIYTEEQQDPEITPEEDYSTSSDTEKTTENQSIVQNEQSNMSKLANGNIQNCQNDLTPVANGNIQNCQNDLTIVSNHTNNKHLIINTDNKLKEKEIYKEKESLNSVSQELLDFWNSKKLMHCPTLTNELKKAILLCLNSFTPDEIKVYISRYAEILHSESYFFRHEWSFKSFLTQHNAMKEFTDTGEKWLSYQSWLTKNKNSSQQQEFIHNNYSKEVIDSLISNLDEIEI